MSTDESVRETLERHLGSDEVPEEVHVDEGRVVVVTNKRLIRLRRSEVDRALFVKYGGFES